MAQAGDGGNVLRALGKDDAIGWRGRVDLLIAPVLSEYRYALRETRAKAAA